MSEWRIEGWRIEERGHDKAMWWRPIARMSYEETVSDGYAPISKESLKGYQRLMAVAPRMLDLLTRIQFLNISVGMMGSTTLGNDLNRLLKEITDGEHASDHPSVQSNDLVPSRPT